MTTSLIKSRTLGRGPNIGSAPSLFILFVLVVYPLAMLLLQIVFPELFSPHMSWHFSLTALVRVLENPLNMESIVNSTWMGVVAAILSVIIGTLTAFGAMMASGPLRTFINMCVWMIFFAPSFIIASGWVILLPLVLETVISTFLIAFTGTMFELPAATLLYPPGQPPFSVVIDHMFSDANWAAGSALTMVGMVIVFGSYVSGNYLLRKVFGKSGMNDDTNADNDVSHSGTYAPHQHTVAEKGTLTVAQ